MLVLGYLDLSLAFGNCIRVITQIFDEVGLDFAEELLAKLVLVMSFWHKSVEVR